MNLFINYYDAGYRANEIDFCLEKNLANPFIEKVIVFNEHPNPPKHKKIILINSEKRPTYQDFFNETLEYEGVNIISNSDIFFDKTIGLSEKISLNQCYALTRYEYVDEHRSVFFEQAHSSTNNSCPAYYSQDVWIFRNGCKLTDCDEVIAMKTNHRSYDVIRFTIGIPGCDNVIAAKLKSKYQVLNPCFSIKCHHVHKTDKRNGYSHRITGKRTTWGIIGQGKVNPSKL